MWAMPAARALHYNLFAGDDQNHGQQRGEKDFHFDPYRGVIAPNPCPVQMEAHTFPEIKGRNLSENLLPDTFSFFD